MTSLLPTLGLATMLLLAVTDHRTGKMPNVITLGSFLLALGLSWGIGGRFQLLIAVVGAFICALVPLVLFFATQGKAIGGGDVKALAALGAWLGPMAGLEAEMVGFTVLAAFGLAREIWLGSGLALLKRSFSLLVPPFRTEESKRQMVELRFGPSLFVGTAIVCASGSVI